MGFMGAKLFPSCESMCVCCPALRPSSRRPVKRYKKLLAEIFPKTPVSAALPRAIVGLTYQLLLRPLNNGVLSSIYLYNYSTRSTERGRITCRLLPLSAISFAECSFRCCLHICSCCVITSAGGLSEREENHEAVRICCQESPAYSKGM
jgi:hypothetical protein